MLEYIPFKLDKDIGDDEFIKKKTVIDYLVDKALHVHC